MPGSTLMRRFLKVLGAICVVFALCVLVLWGIWTKPYLEKTIVRSSIPERILVEYVLWACGDTYPRLTEVFPSSLGQRTLAEEPFFISLPSDVLNPEESMFASNGNQFILQAFRNDMIIRNRITGKTKRERTHRLAVFAWEIVPPYDVWIQKDGVAITVPQDRPVKYVSQSASLGPFYDAKQDPCL